MKKFVPFMLLFFIPSLAYAGVMDYVKAIGTSGSLWIAIVSGVLVVILKKIPNKKIYNLTFNFFKKLGIFSTVGLNRWKWSAPFWEKYIEPWFIDFIQNTVGAATNGYIEGLRTNNKVSTDGK